MLPFYLKSFKFKSYLFHYTCCEKRETDLSLLRKLKKFLSNSALLGKLQTDVKFEVSRCILSPNEPVMKTFKTDLPSSRT